MFYRVLTDVVVVVHILFVLFVITGGFLFFRSRRFAWLHLPAVVWAVLVEINGWICPLTPLENWLRERIGKPGYRSGFIEHHFIPLLYPEALTRQMQIVMGACLIILNIGIYGWAMSRNIKG